MTETPTTPEPETPEPVEGEPIPPETPPVSTVNPADQEAETSSETTTPSEPNASPESPEPETPAGPVPDVHGTIQVEEVEDPDMPGLVMVRCDRPGERAVSAVVNGEALIREVADVLGVSVSISENADAEAPA